MLKLGPEQLTREQIEEQIAAVSRDIDTLNCRIAKVEEFVKERDRLRKKLGDLMRQYLQGREEPKKTVFIFNGKNKDLSAALQDEIRKV